MDLLLWWIPEDKIQNYSIPQKLAKHSCGVKGSKKPVISPAELQLLFSTILSSPVFK